jgi:FkbH-like protein
MPSVGPSTTSPPNSPPAFVIAGTFTVDPIVEPLALLLREAGVALSVELAPYGQVFQELLDPVSSLASNRNGINALLLRFEDWLLVPSERAGALDTVQQLIDALSAGPATAPLLLLVCPPSPAALADAQLAPLLAQMEQRLREGVRGLGKVHWIDRALLAPLTAGADVFDLEGERLGHVPYKEAFFAALALLLGRTASAHKQPPHKVLVLDCDNTLWRGVVGEDGVDGIVITPHYQALQRFVLEKKNAGMIVCLASKNVESDVVDVFHQRADMLLALSDVVALKVNWQPKSENLHALAAELNLGLDSFVFIDDNPVECAEVAAACPGVLALNLPVQAGVETDLAGFLASVWPLDQLKVTEEDRRRTELYRENLARDRFEKSAGSLSDFLAGLQLHIEIATPSEAQVPRVAQLTQRTNQFNFSTRRCSESEIAGLQAAGQGCRVVTVADRFGDYGLVGAVIYEPRAEALHVDTLLLSCRVLGRGVEHAMMRTLGELAVAAGLAQVVARFVPTKKNQPARRFLDSLATHEKRSEPDGATSYVFLSAALVGLSHDANGPREAVVEDAGPAKVAVDAGANETKSARWNRLARELNTPAQLLAAVQAASFRPRALGGTIVPAAGPIELGLCRIWREVLRLDDIGVTDDYFEMGGTSLLAVSIFARMEREMGVRQPLAVLTQCPTIRQLAARIERKEDTQSLVRLSAGARTPLFLVHDADGETLLYRNLARRLGGTRAVYGIQPAARPDVPMVHTRIEEMAAHYVAEMRRVQPQGPYLLGGLCAGGVIAYEMARLLEQVGERTHLVALFDAADVSAEARPDVEKTARNARLRDAITKAGPLQLPGVVARKAYGYLRWKVTTELLGSWHRFAIRTLRYCLSERLPVPSWVRRLSVRQVYVNAESEYRPSHRVREDIVLFRATEGEGPDVPYVRVFFDPLLGWGKRSAATVRAFDVPGGHGTMLQEPHVAAVAQRLSHLIEEIESTPPANAEAGIEPSRAEDPARGGQLARSA